MINQRDAIALAPDPSAPADSFALVAPGAIVPDESRGLTAETATKGDVFEVTFTLRYRVDPRRVAVFRGGG